MKHCPTCEEYIDEERQHTCEPMFEVIMVEEWGEEYEDDWVSVRGSDYNEAAEKYAEEDDWNSSEFSIVGGNDAKILVRKLGESKIKKFNVSGEPIPEYNAVEIEEKS